jgi:hypothetical protein
MLVFCAYIRQITITNKMQTELNSKPKTIKTKKNPKFVTLEGLVLGVYIFILIIIDL